MRRLISALGLVAALAALGAVLVTATLVDRRPPSIEGVALSATVGDDRLAQTITAIDIDFSEAVREAGVERRFRIDPYVAGAFTWDGSTLIFTPSARLPQATEFTVSVEPGYEDLAGNVATAGLDLWAFRTVGAPEVVAATPADGSAGVPVDAVLELEFDRLMDTAAVEAAITVDPPASIRATWSGSSVRLAFEPALEFGTAYTVEVGSGAADTAGNGLPEPYSTSFTTVDAGIAVLGTVPRDGVAGVSVDTPIVVSFDAPIAFGSVQNALTITPRVVGSFVFDAITTDDPAASPALGPDASVRLVFRPAGPLPEHTTFTVTLASVIQRAGAPGVVAEGRTWSFTTGARAASAQNQIAFLSDRTGLRSVWLMNPDGTNPRQLTAGLAPVSAYALTLDGRVAGTSSAGTVEVLELENGDITRMTDTRYREYAPVFTPDDRWVLVGRRDRAGADLGWWLVPMPGNLEPERRVVPDGAPPLGSADAAGPGLAGIGDDSPWLGRSAFDPTGRWILLVDATGAVRLVDLAPPEDPTTPVVSSVGLTSGTSASWQPTSSRFVLTAAGTSGRSAVWAVALDGSPVAVGGSDGAAAPVAVGPGGLLATTSVDAGGRSIVLLVRPDGSSDDYATSPVFDPRWPVFSPDGGSILFGRSHALRPDDPAGLWRLDLATGAIDQISPDGAWPRWLP